MRADVMFAWSFAVTILSLYNILEDVGEEREHRTVNMLCSIVGGCVAFFSFLTCINKYW